MARKFHVIAEYTNPSHAEGHMRIKKRRNVSIPDELFGALRSLSSSVGISANDLAEEVLTNYAERMHAAIEAGRERRSSQRARLDIPAVMVFHSRDEKTSFYKVVKIIDVSLSGVCLRVSKGSSLTDHPVRPERDFTFDIMFSLPEIGKEVAYRCEEVRRVGVDDAVYFSAQFIGDYHGSHDVMQRFLM